MTADQDDLLRSMVREVLRDVLPGIVEEKTVRRLGSGGTSATSAAPASSPPTSAGPSPARAPAESDRELVVLRTDADLDAFVQRLLRLAENPATRHHLRSGRRRFGLATGASASSDSAAPTSAPRTGLHRIERGALTERQVRQAAAAGEQIIIARSVVITPLARDRARALGVEITKEP